MELGPKGHCMDDDRIFVRIVVEDDDLELSTRNIRADDEIPAFAGNHPKRISDGMVDVLISDPVLARAVRYLHLGQGNLVVLARQGHLVRGG
jgi:hypothetical protein